MNNYINVAIDILRKNLCIEKKEKILIVTDSDTEEIAEFFYKASLHLDNDVLLIKMPPRSKSGEEPPYSVGELMKTFEVILCITKYSLTHTRARKNASNNGARVATMPGITLGMLKQGAITADYEEVQRLTKVYCELLDTGEDCKIIKDNKELTFSIKGRKSISSTGVFQKSGESGNLPSGESFIAPIEQSVNGSIYIDGAIAGLGVVEESILLTIEDGRLTYASGDMGKRLLNMLGDGIGRTVAEFGIGTNKKALLTGNVLEDEKVFGTVHIAFGSNKSFGGTTDAGVHIDCIIKEPIVYIDKKELKF